MSGVLGIWLPVFLSGAGLGGLTTWAVTRRRPARPAPARIAARPFQRVDVELLGRVWRGVVVQVEFEAARDAAVVALVSPVELLRRYSVGEGK